MEDPPGKFFRLAPGREVRLRYAYLVTCTSIIHDENGNVSEVRCTYDPETKGGNTPDGRKVKGTIHWVSAKHSLNAQVRLYQPLFKDPNPKFGSDTELEQILNPNSCETIDNCKLEPSLGDAGIGRPIQLERLGYFCVDPSSTNRQSVLNRTVSLRDTWARVKAK